jgi:hypothetical protein
MQQIDSTSKTSQLGLFEGRQPSTSSRPLARRTDPASSHYAAAEIVENRTRQSRRAAVLAFLRDQDVPLTSFELARAANLDRYAVARALPDLFHDHLVERHEMRACRITGRQSITWRARG